MAMARALRSRQQSRSPPSPPPSPLATAREAAAPGLASSGIVYTGPQAPPRGRRPGNPKAPAKSYLTWKKDQGSGVKTKELYEAYRSRHAAFHEYLIVRPNPELWHWVGTQQAEEESSSSSPSVPLSEEAEADREKQLKEKAKKYAMFSTYKRFIQDKSTPSASTSVNTTKRNGRQSSSSSSSSSKSSAEQAAAASLIDLSQAPSPPQQKKKPCRGPLTSLAKDVTKANNMKDAIADAEKAGEGANIARIADKHNVPRTTLRRQLAKPNPTDFRHFGRQPVLGPAVEAILLEYVNYRFSVGQALRWPRLLHLSAALAQDLARRLPQSDYQEELMAFKASSGWLNNFRQRHKEVLTSRRAQNSQRARAVSCSEATMKEEIRLRKEAFEE
jgi:hypothetical protein